MDEDFAISDGWRYRHDARVREQVRDVYKVIMTCYNIN
jgi:hypothetical protein